MVEKPNKDSHRYSYSGGVKAVEEQKWGRAKAEERYGPLQFRDGAPPPKDRSMPEDPMAKRGPDWADDTPNNWLRGANEDATTKPNFDKGKR